MECDSQSDGRARGDSDAECFYRARKDEQSEREYLRRQMNKNRGVPNWQIFRDLLCCGGLSCEEAALCADLRRDVLLAQLNDKQIPVAYVRFVCAGVSDYLKRQHRRPVAVKLYAVHEYLLILLERFGNRYVITF